MGNTLYPAGFGHIMKIRFLWCSMANQAEIKVISRVVHRHRRNDHFSCQLAAAAEKQAPANSPTRHLDVRVLNSVKIPIDC